MLRKERLNNLKKFAFGARVNQDEEEVLAACMYLILKSGVSCDQILFYSKDCQTPVSIDLLKEKVFIFGSYTSLGYINIINDLCADPTSWSVETHDLSALDQYGIPRPSQSVKMPSKNNFSLNLSGANDLFSILLVFADQIKQGLATFIPNSVKSHFPSLVSFEEAWNSISSGNQAVQMLSNNFPEFMCDGEEDSSEEIRKERNEKEKIKRDRVQETDPNTCEGWERYIAQTEGRSTVPNDGYNVVTMFYTKRHDGTSYGDGEKVRSAFSQYVDVCRKYPNCRYENFVAWYKYNAEMLGRQFNPAEAVSMMDQEMSECVRGTEIVPEETRTISERPREEEKKECNKNWEVSYVERLISELLNQNEPIVTSGQPEIKGSYTQAVSPSRVRSLTARYIRRMFPGIQRLSGDNIRDVAKEVTRRLTQPAYDPGTGRYCKTVNRDRGVMDQLNRAKVFFALQDEFKGRRRSAPSYKDYRKTDRQMQRSLRRKDRRRYMRELPEGGPTPRRSRRRLFRR